MGRDDKTLGKGEYQALRSQRPTGRRMVTDLQIYRTAQVLAREHGVDSLLRAAMQSDALLDRGDLYGAAVWKRILAAIEVLLGDLRPSGSVLH